MNFTRSVVLRSARAAQRRFGLGRDARAQASESARSTSPLALGVTRRPHVAAHCARRLGLPHESRRALTSLAREGGNGRHAVRRRVDAALSDGQLVSRPVEPARPAVFTPSRRPRPARAVGADRSRHRGALRQSGEVWEAAPDGEHVCVSTGTASGQVRSSSRCPCSRRVPVTKRARAIYVYTTKEIGRIRSARCCA